MREIRIKYLDQAKAVGILLMIVGHCYWKESVPYLNNIIYSFHMPLFFIISGMFIKPLDISLSIEKYGKAYLYPYLKVNAVAAAIILLWGLYNTSFGDYLYSLISRIFFASGSAAGTELFADTPIICAFWFLFALFWGTIITSYIIKKYDKPEQLVIITALFALSCISIRYIRLPFSLQAGFSVPIFLITGYYMKKTDFFIGRVNFITFILMFLVWAFCALKGFVSVSHCVYQNGLLDVIGAIFGTIIFILVIKKYVSWFDLKWTGTHTLELLSGHQVVLLLFCYTGNLFCDLPFSPTLNFIVEIICQITLSYVIGYILSKTILYKNIR